MKNVIIYIISGQTKDSPHLNLYCQKKNKNKINEKKLSKIKTINEIFAVCIVVDLLPSMDGTDNRISAGFEAIKLSYHPSNGATKFCDV